MRSWIALAFAGLATMACHRAPPAPAPAPASTPSAAEIAARARADSIAAAQRARSDSLAEAARLAAVEKSRQEEEARIARIRLAIRDTLAERTYFAFDRSDIRPEDRAVLDRKLAILRANPMLVLQIAGHADERGSDEYNLALGSRRAVAARLYFTSRGIAPDRLQVVSYGEERPLVVGHDESAWSRNRRDEFMPVAGADYLEAPIASR